MLRTPTHIVELGTNTTTTKPFIQKFHTGGSAQKSTAKQQQQQSKLYHDHHCYRPEYQLQSKAVAGKTPTSSKNHLQQQSKESLTPATPTPTPASTTTSTARSLLSSTPFSFKRIKKFKTTTTAAAPATIAGASGKTSTATTKSVDDYVSAKATAYITLTRNGFISNNNSTNSNNNNNNNSSNKDNNNYLSAAANKTGASIKPTKDLNLSTSTSVSTLKSSPSSSSASASSAQSSSFESSSVSSSATILATAAAATATAASTAAAAAAVAATTTSHGISTPMSPTSQTPTRTSSLFDSCHRKIRLIGGGPVAFLGGLVAKARRKDRDGDQNSTDTKLYLEESVLERKLPEADLKALVDLPAGLDYNEWLASHTLALFEHVNLVYGTISEFCTPSGCPDMTGPGNRTYLWFDEKGKKTRVAAPQYIDYVMTFTQKTVSDESIFPTKYANEFPSSFESIARKILRLQFHVIAHLYAAHFREIALLGLHTHLNLTFAHLTALHRRFNLIDEKETDVLRDLEVALRLTDDSQTPSIADSASTATATAMATAATAAMTTTTMDSSSSNSSTTAMNNGTSAAAAGALTAATHHNTTQQQQQTTGGESGAGEDVNLMQQQQQQQQMTTTTTAAGASAAAAANLIDGDAATPPICTQPATAPTSGFGGGGVGGCGGGGGVGGVGGGGGLIGGILGDLTTGEFGDTTGYCTSAVPSATSACNAPGEATTANCNNGAGAPLHLNFNNNHPLHHHHHQNQHQHQHHHHHLHMLHHHHLHQPQPLQNSGLIQCNANNAPTSASPAAVAAAAAASASTAAAANAAATTTTA